MESQDTILESKHPAQMSLKNEYWSLTSWPWPLISLEKSTYRWRKPYHLIITIIGTLLPIHIFCILTLSPTSADKDQKGKYSVPILDVKSRQLVLDTNQTLLLGCRWVSGRLIQANLGNSVGVEQGLTMIDTCKSNQKLLFFCYHSCSLIDWWDWFICSYIQIFPSPFFSQLWIFSQNISVSPQQLLASGSASGELFVPQ